VPLSTATGEETIEAGDDSMMDSMVEARVMNRLQERKHGQTIEQLQEHLKEPEAKILAVLEVYKKENLVRRTDKGVWIMVRPEAK
jgi:hypothetical protein